MFCFFTGLLTAASVAVSGLVILSSNMDYIRHNCSKCRTFYSCFIKITKYHVRCGEHACQCIAKHTTCKKFRNDRFREDLHGREDQNTSYSVCTWSRTTGHISALYLSTEVSSYLFFPQINYLNII